MKRITIFISLAIFCMQHISMPLRKENSWPGTRRGRMEVTNSLEEDDISCDGKDNDSKTSTGNTSTDSEPNKQV